MTPQSSSDPREQFELPSGQIYLLAHSVGCLPKATRQALQRKVLDQWGQDPARAWPNWMEALGNFRQALAGFLGGEASQYCPQVNVSGGFSKILGALPPQKTGRTLLLSESDFPSLGFVAQCAHKLGWSLKWLSASLDHCNPQVWDDALDDSVDAVLATHVQYSTNRAAPIEQISHIARSRGILSVLDICQSAGVVPLNLPSINADVVLGSCIKWLCGGPGAGYLWLNPSPTMPLEPADVGWFSHEDPFEFKIHDFRYSEHADRFFGGTPSVLPFVAATVGIQTLAKIGIREISRHNRALSQLLRDAVDPELLLSASDPTQRGGTTVIALSANDPRIARLKNHQVAFDARKFGIRLSPHVYTSVQEISKICELLV